MILIHSEKKSFTYSLSGSSSSQQLSEVNLRQKSETKKIMLYANQVKNFFAIQKALHVAILQYTIKVLEYLQKTDTM